jgi:hypothetical protein
VARISLNGGNYDENLLNRAISIRKDKLRGKNWNSLPG